MKKIIFILVLLFSVFFLQSCEKDQSLDPRPLIIDGQYVRLDITSKRLNFDDITNTYFGGTLSTPGSNNKVAKYNLYVRKTDINQFATEFVLLKTVTSFPYELKVTPQDIATALNVPESSLVFGDLFRFYGESFDNNGTRVDFYNLSATVQSTASMKQGYRFITDMTNTNGMAPSELFGYDNYTAQ